MDSYWTLHPRTHTGQLGGNTKARDAVLGRQPMISIFYDFKTAMAIKGLELKKNEYRKQKQDGRRSTARQMCSPKCSVGVQHRKNIWRHRRYAHQLIIQSLHRLPAIESIKITKKTNRNTANPSTVWMNTRNKTGYSPTFFKASMNARCVLITRSSWETRWPCQAWKMNRHQVFFIAAITLMWLSMVSQDPDVSINASRRYCVGFPHCNLMPIGVVFIFWARSMSHVLLLSW